MASDLRLNGNKSYGIGQPTSSSSHSDVVGSKETQKLSQIYLNYIEDFLLQREQDLVIQSKTVKNLTGANNILFWKLFFCVSFSKHDVISRLRFEVQKEDPLFYLKCIKLFLDIKSSIDKPCDLALHVEEFKPCINYCFNYLYYNKHFNADVVSTLIPLLLPTDKLLVHLLFGWEILHSWEDLFLEYSQGVDFDYLDRVISCLKQLEKQLIPLNQMISVLDLCQKAITEITAFKEKIVGIRENNDPIMKIPFLPTPSTRKRVRSVTVEISEEEYLDKIVASRKEVERKHVLGQYKKGS